MSTSTQNWYPNMPEELPFEHVPSDGVLTGTGVPDNSLGENGNIYVRTSNGVVYTKSGDVWNIVTGGGGGTNNKSGAGTPVGTQTPDYVGQTYTDTNSPHFFWVAVGLTNADWVEVAGNLT